LWNSPGVQRPRLLLVPSFTELEWSIRPQLEEWADVASFDMPGVGEERLPDGLDPDPRPAPDLVSRWRRAANDRALEELDRRGWDRFFLVTDSRGVATAVEAAARRPEAVQGLAIGHAALSKATEGTRPPERAGVWDALAQLAKQGNEIFVRHGIAQVTQGGLDEETTRRMTERFPDMALVSAMIEALGREPEPIGDQLATLDRPLLLAKHEGCLGSTDEGFEDIVAAFPGAETVICPEACSSSPAFAVATRRFCDRLSERRG
jgi:pimeloyl-ACP methyl ester carboxylesterase